MNKQQILNIIQKLSKINDGKDGHCGNFAVALNRLIGNTGKYWVMSDDVEPNARFYHVLLEVNDVLYDVDGVQTEEDVLLEYGSDENDDGLEFDVYPLEDDCEWMVLSSRTDHGDEDTVEEILLKYKEDNP